MVFYIFDLLWINGILDTHYLTLIRQFVSYTELSCKAKLKSSKWKKKKKSFICITKYFSHFKVLINIVCRNWLIRKSPVSKLDLLREAKLFSMQNLYIDLYIICISIVPKSFCQWLVTDYNLLLFSIPPDNSLFEDKLTFGCCADL